jgi:TupA-like ATPgrasp
LTVTHGHRVFLTEIHNYAKIKFRGTWVHFLWNHLQGMKIHLFRRSYGRRLLLEQYTRKTGKQLNIANPQLFSEKLYHRMITWTHKQDPIYTQLTDKYSVRNYVARKIGEQHLVKLLWHGEDPRAIPFDALPMEYVIKANHASAQVIIVNGIPDREELVRMLTGWLKTNYFVGGGENQYYHIKPRVLIEEYLRSQDGAGPFDYKFWCFDGTPQVIHVDNYARDINPFFDPEWNLLDLHYREGASRPALAKPKNFTQMLSLASQLSAGFDFVRVDLYNVDGNIYFGELTFSPAGSLMLRPSIWDSKLGEKWKLSSAA